jgi:RNA polymerase sigma-70 factor (ECF subfamily)
LLEEQDRNQWDKTHLQEGLSWLGMSASGDHLSRYHAEAGIAAEHALAPTFEATRWDRIASHYARLEHLAPAPLHRLNRAVAVAEWQGPQAGLALLTGYDAPAWLTQSYLWEAVLSDLHARCGNADQANTHQETALRTAPNGAIENLLRRRFDKYRSAGK